MFGAGAATSPAPYRVGAPHATFVLASPGGSPIFLCGLTRAPAAQLRAILGGHLGAGCIGMARAPFLGSSLRAHWGALLNPVLLGVVCLVWVAMVWSRAHPGLVHCPVSPLEPSPPSLDWGGWQ